MEQKTWTRAVSFLLLVAIVFDLIPAAFASDEASEIEPPMQSSSVEETITEDDTPVSVPEQSTIEADEPEDDSVPDEMEPEGSEDDDWDFDDDWDGPPQ